MWRRRLGLLWAKAGIKEGNVVGYKQFHSNYVDKYWRDQPLLYDFKAELAGTGDRSKCEIEV